MAQRKTRPPRIRLRANVIAEKIYSQVDADGHHSLVIDEILDHSTYLYWNHINSCRDPEHAMHLTS